MRNGGGKFTKGNPGKPKGAISKKTILWNQLGEWFISDGASKFIHEMKNLEGKEFISAYSLMLEYFKPKLSRSEIIADIGEIPSVKELFEMSTEDRKAKLIEIRNRIEDAR